MTLLSQQARGIALLIFSASSFAVVDGLSKVLAQTQSVGQIVWARYALSLPVLFLMVGPRRWPTLYITNHRGQQIRRGLTPLFISVTMVLAVRYMPLADATVILFMAPFLVVALSGFMLNERVGLVNWIGVVIGFAAVLLVTRPGLAGFSVYLLFPAVAAVFYALMQLLTRRLGAAGERPETTLAWTLSAGAIAATPLAIFTWAPTTPQAWVLLVSLGTVFGLAQFLMIRAYALAAAGLLAPFSYVQIVAAVVFGMVVFGDMPDFWTLCGIALIIFAGLLVMRRGRAG